MIPNANIEYIFTYMSPPFSEHSPNVLLANSRNKGSRQYKYKVCTI